MLDIYFNEDYGKLGEYVEPGRNCVFQIDSENGSVRHMFILRTVPWLVDGVQYYDIVTPYGYGGPIVTRANNPDRLIGE